MKIGIIGAGFMGSTHAAGWANTDAEIVGFVAKPGEAAAHQLAEQHNAQVYSDLEALLPLVDVIDICTPTHLHYAMALKAAESCKYIFCEKPLTRTLEESQELIAVCKKAGIKLSVGHVVRFFPEYKQAKALVDSGQIGQLAVVRLARETFCPKKAEDNWFVDLDKSGGVILDLMVHDFDYARWLAGDVESVFAKNILSSSPDAHIDHALVILTHKNGVLSHIEGSWAFPPPMFRTRFEISGSGGMIDHDSQATSPINILMQKQVDGKTPDIPTPTSPVSEDPWTTQIKAFYKALIEDSPLPVPAEEGLAALQIALAAIESARTNKAVNLETLPELSS
ncbi:MAG: Gfo/Idh/MocA family oxidoreductase [Anaerolineales bacterium]|nr:Gfo/Idh/MocA family oxidoreductase [Anaerolineales bacterium]